MKTKTKKEKSVKKQKENGVKEEKNSVKQKNKKIKLKTQQADDNEIILKNSINSDKKESGQVLIKSVDTTIFQYFKELTNENEKERMQAALHLLQQLAKTKDPEKRKKETNYALKRLVRGCGAATNVSRTGFYTALVALLKAYNVEELPLSLVFETMDKELHVGSMLTNKEDSDAVVGRILICSAILHTNRIHQISKEDLNKMTSILLTSTRHKSYHVSLGYSFLTELLDQVNEEQFKASVWPLLQVELSKPWTKQNIQTIHCMIKAQNKFPKLVNSKFMKSVYGGLELLNDESYNYLYKIFWEHTNIDILAHPALEEFGKNAANCSKLVEFWENTINQQLEKSSTKLMELITLKITTDILNNMSPENAPKILHLLNDNFIKMLIEGLKVIKQRKDETIKAFYTEFLESIVSCSSKINNDSQKVAIIKRLILQPGIFDIEKYAGTRIIHQLINYLGEEGIKDLYNLYNGIFLNTFPKSANRSETWSQFERLNAGYMLQHLLHHKNVQKSFKWRQHHLESLLIFGIFHVNNNNEVCQKTEQSAFSEKFAEQCRNMFFTSLQSKFTDLPEDHKLLIKLVKSCHQHLEKKSYKKFLRLKNFDKPAYDAWNRMFNIVSSNLVPKTKQDSNEDKLQIIFQILLLNMGLHLFKEPEMAIPSIDDLLKCMERINKKQKQKNKTNANPNEEDEPEWIEVVVDLLLHLLSQNSSSLRHIVDGLFAHLCSNLNINSVHHILSMLDMKDGNNPLSTRSEQEEEDEDEDEDDDENEDEENDDEEEDEDDGNESNENKNTKDEEETIENDANDSNDDNEDSDDEETETEDEIEEDDEDDGEEDLEVISNTDKLRNAISQALMESGAGIVNQDDDMDSIDLNDITEEEGRKLDEALGNAFKLMKEAAGGGFGTPKKKTKVYRIQTTTVMHFRIRVLDLIEIYLQKNPSLMMITEILISIFNMLEYCISEELKPLHTKVEKVLHKLSQMKPNSFEIDLQEDNLVDFIRLLVEKKTAAAAYNSTNILRNKCVIFLINCSIRACPNTTPTKLITLFEEYAQDFVIHRNPTINITLLSDLFKLRWIHLWPIAFSLVKTALTKETRGFRRLQTYEVLSLLYGNIHLLKLNPEITNKFLSKLEKPISGFIISLAESSEDIRQTPKEFQNLLELLLAVHKTHNHILKTSSILSSSDICECIQKLRRLIRLENFNTYHHYCSVFKLQVIRNKDLERIQENGKDSFHQNNNHNPNLKQHPNDKVKASNKEDKMKKPLRNGHHLMEVSQDFSSNSNKRKSSSESGKDLKKLKKQKKQLRLEASSKGLVAGHSFASSIASMNGTVDSAASADDDLEN